MDRIKSLFCILIIATFVNTGFCIKCYNCVSTSNEECLNPSEHKNLQPQKCTPNLLENLSGQVKQYASSIGAAIGFDVDKSTSILDHNLVCQKVVTEVDKKQIIVRGCQLKDTGNVNSCKTIENSHSAVTHCSVCEEDGCNSGHWLAPLSFSAVLFPSLVLAMPALFF